MFIVGARAAQDHVGGEMFCRWGSIYEAFNQLPWQNSGVLDTFAKDPAKPEVWGWSLPDRVLMGAAVLKCPVASEGQ
jgi:hypothetical protein